MKIDPSVLVQKQVRENTQDVQNYLLDLKNWEEGIKKKEQRRVYLSSSDGTTASEKKQVTREDVDYVKSVFEDGVRQMKNGKWDKAASSFSKAIKKYNKNPVFFIKRAKCNLKLKRYKEAETDCTATLALDPKILKAKFYRSKAREMRNNLRGACLDLQDIVILDPGNQIANAEIDRLRPFYLETLGGGSTKLFVDEVTNKEIGVLDVISSNDTAAEEADLEEKIQRANIEKERGNRYVKAENWEEAKDSYTKAISLYPNDAIFYANRALCHMKLQNVPRCILDCGMALKKNPRYAKAYFRRATARKATNDLWGARSDVKQLLLLEPYNSAAKQELEELNILIEDKVYADYTVHERESSSSGEDGSESAEDLPHQTGVLTHQPNKSTNLNKISEISSNKLSCNNIFNASTSKNSKGKNKLVNENIEYNQFSTGFTRINSPQIKPEKVISPKYVGNVNQQLLNHVAAKTNVGLHCSELEDISTKASTTKTKRNKKKEDNKEKPTMEQENLDYLSFPSGGYTGNNQFLLPESHPSPIVELPKPIRNMNQKLVNHVAAKTNVGLHCSEPEDISTKVKVSTTKTKKNKKKEENKQKPTMEQENSDFLAFPSAGYIGNNQFLLPGSHPSPIVELPNPIGNMNQQLVNHVAAKTNVGLHCSEPEDISTKASTTKTKKNKKKEENKDKPTMEQKISDFLAFPSGGCMGKNQILPSSHHPSPIVQSPKPIGNMNQQLLNHVAAKMNVGLHCSELEDISTKASTTKTKKNKKKDENNEKPKMEQENLDYLSFPSRGCTGNNQFLLPKSHPSPIVELLKPIGNINQQLVNHEATKMNVGLHCSEPEDISTKASTTKRKKNKKKEENKEKPTMEQEISDFLAFPNGGYMGNNQILPSSHPSPIVQSPKPIGNMNQQLVNHVAAKTNVSLHCSEPEYISTKASTTKNKKNKKKEENKEKPTMEQKISDFLAFPSGGCMGNNQIPPSSHPSPIVQSPKPIGNINQQLVNHEATKMNVGLHCSEPQDISTKASTTKMKKNKKKEENKEKPTMEQEISDFLAFPSGGCMGNNQIYSSSHPSPIVQSPKSIGRMNQQLTNQVASKTNVGLHCSDSEDMTTPKVVPSASSSDHLQFEQDILYFSSLINDILKQPSVTHGAIPKKKKKKKRIEVHSNSLSSSSGNHMDNNQPSEIITRPHPSHIVQSPKSMGNMKQHLTNHVSDKTNASSLLPDSKISTQNNLMSGTDSMSNHDIIFPLSLQNSISIQSSAAEESTSKKKIKKKQNNKKPTKLQENFSSSSGICTSIQSNTDINLAQVRNSPSDQSATNMQTTVSCSDTNQSSTSGKSQLATRPSAEPRWYQSSRPSYIPDEERLPGLPWTMKELQHHMLPSKFCYNPNCQHFF